MAFDPQDIIGRQFGQVTVKEYVGRTPYRKRFTYKYRCECECGTVWETVRSNLITGHTKSCGCLKRRTGGENPCWTGHGDISGRLWGHIRHHAEGRNLLFEITIEDAWGVFQAQAGRCALTGIPISLRTVRGEGPNAESASLDRIDNSKGYVTGNVQWLHKDINWMKGSLDQRKFIELCCAVANKVNR